MSNVESPTKRGKAVHLSSVHRADDTRIFYKECRSLAKNGYDVVLIARADCDFERDKVQIRSVKVNSTQRIARMTMAAWQVYRKASSEEGDIYHFHDPELIPVGLLLKLRGKKVIFDVHEDVSRQIIDKRWIPKRLRRPVSYAYRALEFISTRIFDGIVAATPSIAKAFPPDKTIVVQNFPLESEMPSASTGPYEERESAVAYVGGLTAKRGATEMLDALNIVNQNRDVRLRFAGSITPTEYRETLNSHSGWQFVEDHGWQDRRGVTTLFARSRVGLVLFHPAANHMESQPNKLFEYMSAGLPVVASDFPYWSRFISDVRAGLQVDPKDPRAIASAISWLLEHPEEARKMGENGQRTVKEHYTWEREVESLLSFYRSRKVH